MTFLCPHGWIWFTARRPGRRPWWHRWINRNAVVANDNGCEHAPRSMQP